MKSEIRYSVVNPGFCEGCGCSENECKISQYWDDQDEVIDWLCDSCAKECGYEVD